MDALRLYLTTSLIGRLVSGVTLKEASGMFTLQGKCLLSLFWMNTFKGDYGCEYTVTSKIEGEACGSV